MRRPGDGHALLLAAGELVGAVAQAAVEAHEAGQFVGPLVVGLGQLAVALIGQRQLDVLHHRVLLDQVVRLEDEADVAASHLRQLVVVELGDILVSQDVLPAGGPVEAAQEVQHRALAEPDAPMMATYSPA